MTKEVEILRNALKKIEECHNDREATEHIKLLAIGETARIALKEADKVRE